MKPSITDMTCRTFKSLLCMTPLASQDSDLRDEIVEFLRSEPQDKQIVDCDLCAVLPGITLLGNQVQA